MMDTDLTLTPSTPLGRVRCTALADLLDAVVNGTAPDLPTDTWPVILERLPDEPGTEAIAVDPSAS